jgi:hypothetical protein
MIPRKRSVQREVGEDVPDYSVRSTDCPMGCLAPNGA